MAGHIDPSKPRKTPERHNGSGVLLSSQTRYLPGAVSHRPCNARSPSGRSPQPHLLQKLPKSALNPTPPNFRYREQRLPPPAAHFRRPGARAWGVPLRQKGGGNSWDDPTHCGGGSLRTPIRDRRVSQGSVAWVWPPRCLDQLRPSCVLLGKGSVRKGMNLVIAVEVFALEVPGRRRKVFYSLCQWRCKSCKGKKGCLPFHFYRDQGCSNCSRWPQCA